MRGMAERAGLVVIATALAGPALAHTGAGAVHGFGAGLMHPLFGVDHVLAMVAVGLWAGLTGGRARFALSSPSSDAKSGAILKARMLELFPQLAQTRIDYCWGGLVDMTADRLPRAGERDGVFYATGYSGHGTQMSVHMGQIMARVMGGDTAANPLAGLDWPVVPGHFGPPWFLPFVGMYYRYQDWRH